MDEENCKKTANKKVKNKFSNQFPKKKIIWKVTERTAEAITKILRIFQNDYQ